MEKPQSSRNRIVLEGDKISVGVKEFHIQQIRNVWLSFYASTPFWRMSIVALGVFFMTILLMFGVGIFSILGGGTASSASSGTLGVLFFLGMSLTIGIFLTAMLVYRPVWRVELSTIDDVTHVIYEDRSRLVAQAYANRIRRVLAQRK